LKSDPHFTESWIEYDFNPFFLFDHEGRVLYLNNEAQFLTGKVETSVIFELCHNYASHSFGFRTTMMDLELGNSSFFGITVGYQDEEKIGIRLYKKMQKRFNRIDESGTLTNIYSLIDLCTCSLSTTHPIEFKKEFDPAFPEIKILIDPFTKVLSKIYHCFRDSHTITTQLTLNIGESIRYRGKHYPIFSIRICGENPDYSEWIQIKKIAEEANFSVLKKASSMIFSAPMIT